VNGVATVPEKLNQASAATTFSTGAETLSLLFQHRQKLTLWAVLVPVAGRFPEADRLAAAAIANAGAVLRHLFTPWN